MTKAFSYVDKLAGFEVWLPCRRCHGDTLHDITRSVEFVRVRVVLIGTNEEYFDLDTLESYQVVSCHGCKTPSFRYQHATPLAIDEPDDLTPEDWNSIFSDRESVDADELYPSRIAGRHFLRNLQHVPVEVRAIYSETHKALVSNQPRLAGMGIRAQIESVCDNFGARGDRLVDKINSLVSSGILTQGQADVLHRTRLFGNIAAHEATTIGLAELITAMDIVEVLLMNAYILPQESAKLPRKPPRGKPSKNSP